VITENEPERIDMIKVFRRGAEGPSVRTDGPPYTGEIWRDLLYQDDAHAVGTNYFAPRARTHWHSHPGGQLLLIEHGEGLVGDADGAVRVVAGDMVWTPSGVRHWHGATDTHSLMHTAITFGGVDWAEVVAEADYSAACGLQQSSHETRGRTR
jgi:quercetin dioxygenase-like cupin family protein